MGFKGITITTSEESLGNITAADDAAIFQSLIGSDGVLNIGSKFATTVISNNKVRVSDGVMCVGGHMGRTAYGDYNDMTIENGVSGQNRNDIIYAKFLTSGSADTFTLDVKKGTGTTGTATDPALTQGVLYENATLREFPLWRVKLKGLSIVAVEQMFTLVPTIPELEAKFNELNSNLDKEDAKLLPREITTIVPLLAVSQNNYMVFSFFPLQRADLYDVEFVYQYKSGEEVQVQFTTEQFVIQKFANGLYIYSNNPDVMYWFQSGSMYSFYCTFTKKV